MEAKKRLFMQKMVVLLFAVALSISLQPLVLKPTTVKAATYLRRTGKVTASSLNIRKSAATNSQVLTTAKKGKAVHILGKKIANGKTWYQVRLTVNQKTINGYAVSSYIKINPTKVSSTLYKLAKVKNNSTAMYKTANVYDTKKASLTADQEVIILGNLTVNSVPWTKVKAKVKSEAIYGYVKTSALTKVTATKASTTSYAAKLNKKTTARRIASKVASSKGSLEAGTKLSVKATLTVNGNKWYKCTYKYKEESTMGYILASYVTLDQDALFQSDLGEFPVSYHPYLKKLHEQYPKWRFKAINTGLDWNEALREESKIGRNTISSNAPNGQASSIPFSYLSTEPGAYDWSKDKYTLFDGFTWYSAKDSVIAHYLDPRNALVPERIFQFETLAYDSSHKSGVVASILSNTFMNGSYSVKDIMSNKIVSGVYKDTFMEVGKLAGASPYFLAARAKQELGLYGSGSVSGKYEGYIGYYNYFNIGANDSAGGGAIANGLRFASTGTTFERPWTNPYKSILGGAKYIATSYINKGQNTNYTQKFNVTNPPFYVHQYMTNVMAPTSEARTTYQAYVNMGIISDTMIFYIPVYKNMPSKACELPAAKGNPNNYLKSITVKNGSKKLPLTPTFHYKTTTYTMIVDSNVDKVSISATPISTYASIEGTGTYDLTEGKTKTISLVCTAGDGTKRTYQVKIYREK